MDSATVEHENTEHCFSCCIICRAEIDTHLDHRCDKLFFSAGCQKDSTQLQNKDSSRTPVWDIAPPPPYSRFHCSQVKDFWLIGENRL